MTITLHQKRHEFLHKCFLELLKDYLESTNTNPTISDLTEWSHKQIVEPNNKKEGEI
jgi:hypothetical protein